MAEEYQMIAEGMQVVCDHPSASPRIVYTVRSVREVETRLWSPNSTAVNYETVQMVEVDDSARCPVCGQRVSALGPLPMRWFRPWKCEHKRSQYLGLQETKPDGDEAWMLRNCLDCETTFVERDADGKAVLVAWRR